MTQGLGLRFLTRRVYETRQHAYHTGDLLPNHSILVPEFSRWFLEYAKGVGAKGVRAMYRYVGCCTTVQDKAE